MNNGLLYFGEIESQKDMERFERLMKEDHLRGVFNKTLDFSKEHQLSVVYGTLHEQHWDDATKKVFNMTDKQAKLFKQNGGEFMTINIVSDLTPTGDLICLAKVEYTEKRGKAIVQMMPIITYTDRVRAIGYPVFGQKLDLKKVSDKLMKAKVPEMALLTWYARQFNIELGYTDIKPLNPNAVEYVPDSEKWGD